MTTLHKHLRAPRAAKAIASIALAVLGAYGAMSPAVAQSRTIDEVMAAFIYQFTNYVEWPETAFESETSPLYICVVGNETMYDHLSKLTQGKKFNERPIELRQFETVDEVESCHLLFVSAEALEESEALPAAHELITLTIGDSKTFTRKGGVIRLFESQSKVRIEINIDAARRGEFKISSKLLALAEIVHDENGD